MNSSFVIGGGTCHILDQCQWSSGLVQRGGRRDLSFSASPHRSGSEERRVGVTEEASREVVQSIHAARSCGTGGDGAYYPSARMPCSDSGRPRWCEAAVTLYQRVRPKIRTPEMCRPN